MIGVFDVENCCGLTPNSEFLKRRPIFYADQAVAA